MNIAVVFAGGTGQRMNSRTKPKQFLELHGKPILVYVLEHFQKHDRIDGIVVVCVEDWLNYFQDLIERFRLTKVAAVVPGGDSGQSSIFNGLSKAEELYEKDSIVLIHDGVRPLINEKTITDAISCAEEYGSAITVSQAIETVTVKDETGQLGQIIDRSCCQVARAPQCFRLGTILEAHRRARAEGLYDFIDSASLMHYYGHPLSTVEGPVENIKITTPMDFYIFRAIEEAKENSQIFGI